MRRARSDRSHAIMVDAGRVARLRHGPLSFLLPQSFLDAKGIQPRYLAGVDLAHCRGVGQPARWVAERVARTRRGVGEKRQCAEPVVVGEKRQCAEPVTVARRV